MGTIFAGGDQPQTEADGQGPFGLGQGTAKPQDLFVFFFGDKLNLAFFFFCMKPF